MTTTGAEASGAVTSVPRRRAASARTNALPAMQYVNAALAAPSDEVCNRLLVLAEVEQAQGMEIARRADATVRRGQILAISAIFLVLLLAGYVASLGNPAWATVITGIDVVGVAGIFVTGHVVDKAGRNRETKPLQKSTD